MREKKEYDTRQKRLILSLLQEKQSEHVTADQILSYLKQNAESVGLATVYRNLDKLVQDGVIIKYIGMDGSSASYQYIGDAAEHKDHYHLVCLQCGQMEHLHCNIIEEFAAHIQNEHRFLLDSMKTVFYGYCQNCTAHCSLPGEAKLTCACAHDTGRKAGKDSEE